MEMVKVVSGNIAEIGYEITEFHVEDTVPNIGDLYIKFKSGTTYKYKSVPDGIWDLFREAESLGKYFAAEIKPVYKEVYKLVPIENAKEGEAKFTEVRV